jgi:hypothetical protein
MALPHARIHQRPLRSPLGSGMTVRGWIVLAMVTVAVVGAITAFRSAKTEQDTAILSQRLAEGELLELATLQSVESDELTHEALDYRHKALLLEGGRFLSAAAEARKAGQPSEKADWLEMRAEEEFAADRAISPVLRQFKGLAPGGGPACRSSLDIKLTPSEMVQATVQQEVAAKLARLGIEATWRDPRCEPGPGDRAEAAAFVHEWGVGANGEPFHPASIWSGLQQRIETLHERVRSLALCVAIFTASLACFTFADTSIRLRQRWIKWALFGAGIAAALAAFVVIVLRLDTEAWPLLLAGLIGTPLFGLLLWHLFVAAERKGWCHPRADSGQVHPEAIGPEPSAIPAPVLPHESNGRLTTSIVIALAITVVFSALSGWGYSSADTQADEMALQARGYVADMAKNSDFLGQERIGQLATNLECRARLAATNQRFDRFRRDEDGERGKRLRDETICARRWDKDVDDPRVGADADPEFPQKIVRGAGQSPIPAALSEAPRLAEFHKWQSLALRDAGTTRSRALRLRATWCLATLTLFAIALYMLGQALGMGRHRSAYVLAAAGMLFAVGGVGLYAAPSFARLWQGARLPSPSDCAVKVPDLPAEPSEPWARAAYHYAIGMMYLKVYVDDVEPARRQFNCAVALRPDFADAARRLAYVEGLAGSADSGEAYNRVYQRDRLPGILAKERFALDLLMKNDLPPSAWFLNSYASHNLLDALANKRGEELDISIDEAKDAIRVAESQGHAGEANCSSVCRFTLGLALLARGRIADARNAYLEGVRALDSRRSQERVVSALTGLETLAAMRCGPSMSPGDEAAGCARKLGLDEMKALLVGGPASEGLTLPADKNFTLSASASELTASDRNVAKEDLWLVWYQLEPSWNSWRAMPRVSGPIEDKPNRDGALTVQPSSSHNAASAKGCLATVKYRAELYANGVLLASKLIDPKQDSFAWKRPGIVAAVNSSAGDAVIDRVSQALSTTGGDSSSAPHVQASTREKLLDLNMQFCLPPGWKVARRGSTDGLMRLLETPDGNPGAFLLTSYEPRRLADAGEDDDLINGAHDTLLNAGLITGKEALQRFDRPDAPSPPESAALIYRLWRTREGEAHIVIARSDALEADQLSQMLQSADTIEDETGGNFE